MNTSPITTHLRQVLPMVSQPSIAAALLQDPVVYLETADLFTLNWNEPSSPILRNFDPVEWSPAAIGLRNYVTQVTPTWLCSYPLTDIDGESKKRASAVSISAPISSTEWSLEKATWIALAMRSDYISKGEWGPVLDVWLNNPQPQHGTILACLYGMVPNPIDIFHTMLGTNPSAQNIALVLHAILSNPIEPDDQLTLLGEITEGKEKKYSLPLTARLVILHILQTQRPQLTIRLAQQWQECQSSEINTGNWIYQDPLTYFHELESELYLAATRQITTLEPDPLNVSLNWKKASFSLGTDNLSINQLTCLVEEVHNAINTDKQSTFLACQQTSLYLENYLQKIPNPLLADARIVSIIQELSEILLSINRASYSVHILKAARKLQPVNVTLQFLTAKALQENYQTEEAIQILSTALALSSNRLDIATYLAECLEAIEGWKTATGLRKALYDEANLVPQSNLTRELHALANSAVNSKQNDLALQATQKLLAANLDDGIAYLYQGKAYLQMGDSSEALACITKATELNFDQYLPWIGLSDFYMITGDEEKALAILQSAIQAVPNCVELLTKLGEMHLRRNEYTQAQEVLASIYNSSPILPKVTILYAEALTQVGQVETVEQILLPALVEFPEDLNLIFLYAKTLLVLNKPEQAIPYLESVLDSPRMDQEGPSITYAQALLAVNVNEEGPRFLPSKAIRPLEKVIAKNPANLPARAYLAEILTASQQYDEALDAFQEIFETELINDPIWSTKLSTGMARAALALGKPEVAIAALQDVVNNHPTTSNPYPLLAEAYLEACLFENSLFAAQSAMSYLEIDTTTTPWLVEFFKSFLSKHNTDGLKPTNSSLLDQLLKNSIETVKTIIQTQPNQIGLAINLGDLQLITGETQSAVQSYTSIARSDQAQQSDLENAADHLFALEEIRAGITCLQRAIEIETIDQGTPSTSLLTKLATAYTKVGSVQMAVRYYDQAIQNSPTHLPLHISKARLLLESCQNKDAMRGLEQVYNSIPAEQHNPDLHYMLAIACIAEGNYPDAMEHSSQAVEAFRTINTDNSPPKESSQFIYHPINYYTLAAELSRSLLNYEIGFAYLKEYESLGIQEQQNHADYISYFCLFNELNIELEGKIVQYIEFPSPGKSTTGFPRLLALNARLSAWHDNTDQALEFLKSAIEILTPNAASNHVHPASINILVNTISDYIAVSEAAIELHEWETALSFLHKATQQCTKHPLAQLLLARFYVLQAEYQDLCSACQVIRHAPGPIALSASALRGHNNALAGVSEVFQQWQQKLEQIGMQYDQQMIRRWELRADLILEKPDHIVEAIKELSSFSQQFQGYSLINIAEDASAIFAATRRLSQVNDVNVNLGTDIRTAVKKSLHPVAILQSAIAVTSQNPTDAIEIIGMAINNLKLNRGFQAALLLYYHAYLYNIQGRSLEALENIQTALNIWNDEPRWLHFAAEINSKLGDKRGAIEYLEEAVKYEPGNANHYLSLGKAYLEANEYDVQPDSYSYQKRAVRNLERATNLNPQNPQVWLALAQAYFNAGDLNQAEQNIDQVLALNPNNYDGLSQKAEIALKKNEPGKAHDYAKKAIALFPDRPVAHLYLARALESLNLPQEAIHSLEKALQNSPDPIPLHLKHASLTKQLYGSQAALEELYTIAARYPDDVEVLESLAISYAENNQDEAAIQTAQKSLSLNNASLNVSKQAGLSLLLGRLLRKTGQLDQAIMYLTNAAKLAPDDVESYLELGTTYKERREYQRALQTFNQATNIAQHDPRPYYFAGLTLKDGKDYRQSEIMLRRAANLAPQDVNIRRQLAAVVALNLVHNPNNFRVGIE